MNFNKVIGWCLILMLVFLQIYYFILIIQQGQSLFNVLCIIGILIGAVLVIRSVYNDRIKGN